jgi:poly(3-hydroxybutyrate) depolymerase
MSIYSRAAGGAAAWLWACGSFAAPLPQLAVDPAQVSVSGLSSGGFMAVQMHVAYSGTFTKGAGVVAGGPFNCAEGSIVHATGRCMTHFTGIPVDSLVATTRTWAGSGQIDPVSNLSGSRVYLFSGTQDTTVRPAVMDDLQTYYRSFVPDAAVTYKNDLAAAHAMVTDDYGNACGLSMAPYISNCGFDLAGAMLAHLYGPLKPRNNGSLSGSFVEFDQTAFVSGHGMGATGWAYVPQDCRSGTVRCKLHVVFHGCRQNATLLGDKYVRNTGYNRWADTNQMVVLYPQTSTQAINSCWDWWGYDSPDYAKKSGPQMAAVKAMVDKLTGPGDDPKLPPPPTGLGASGATASSMVLAWGSVSGASGYNLYRNGSKVNAALISGTTFTDTGLAPATTYTWTVTAVDADGRESAASAPATGTTAGDGGGQPPGGGSCTTASNFAHTMAGRARVIWGLTYANGSNQSMGLWSIFVTTTLKQTGPGYYVVGTCS